MTNVSVINATLKSSMRNWDCYSNLYFHIDFSNGKVYWKYMQNKISPNIFF